MINIRFGFMPNTVHVSKKEKREKMINVKNEIRHCPSCFFPISKNKASRLEIKKKILV